LEEKYYIFFVLALLAEIIGTISGFGSSILFVPIASIFIDFKLVLGITAVFHVFSNITKIVLFKHGINKDIIIKLGIPAVIFVIIGALLTKVIPQKEIELLLNIVLVGLAIFLLTNTNKTIPPTNKNLYLGGVSSGFFAGLIGTGGAIRGLVLAGFGLEKNIYIATSAVIDLGVDSSRAAIYIYNGYFLKEHIVFIPALIAISILGTWIGKICLQYISEIIFRKFVLMVIIFTSVFYTAKYIYELNT